jgi:hypothetical protein
VEKTLETIYSISSLGGVFLMGIFGNCLVCFVVILCVFVVFYVYLLCLMYICCSMCVLLFLLRRRTAG